MPVLYVAVGRRLGYPLKLVNAKEHLFARWEDSKQKFNIECTSDKGINCFPDSEYRKWPYRISDAEMRSGMYLRSLTPRQELAMLLNLRAICLKQAGKKNLSLTCKIYADDLLQREGIDLKTVNKGLARSMHADPGFAEAHLKESAVVEIDWVEAKSKEAK